MHFLIVGASGRTGQLVVAEALKQGHHVTALVRRESALKPQDNLRIVVGTPESKADIARACVDVEAVISTLAAPRASDSPFSKPLVPPFFMRDCMVNVTAVMQEKGTERLIVLSAFGVGTSRPQTPLILSTLFRYSNMAVQFEDHDAVEEHVKQSGLKWTSVRPSRLVDEPAKTLKVSEDKAVSMFSSTTRQDVAATLVNAASRSDWEGKAITIIN